MFPYQTMLNNLIVSLQTALHWDKTATSKRLKLFWTAFTGMALWEIFPAYMCVLSVVVGASPSQLILDLYLMQLPYLEWYLHFLLRLPKRELQYSSSVHEYLWWGERE